MLVVFVQNVEIHICAMCTKIISACGKLLCKTEKNKLVNMKNNTGDGQRRRTNKQANRQRDKGRTVGKQRTHQRTDGQRGKE